MDKHENDQPGPPPADMPSHQRPTRRGLVVAGLALVPGGLLAGNVEARKRKRRRKNKNKDKHEQRQGEVTNTLAVASAIGNDWTHVGGSSILFYDRNTGDGLAGTLDGLGFTPVEASKGFATGYDLVVGTPRGSVLFLRNSDGMGAAGTLLNGRWSFLNEYHGFAPWTNAAASADTLFLYHLTRGQGASGTLVNGAWTYYGQYRSMERDYTHFSATDDSLLFYKFNSRASAKAGTLKNGVWTFANSYPDIGNLPYVVDYHMAVGAVDTLLFQGFTGLNFVIGTLANGAWSLKHKYPDAGYWTHAAHAGNGFILLYTGGGFDAPTAWGTLIGGNWSYYGTTLSNALPAA